MKAFISLAFIYLAAAVPASAIDYVKNVMPIFEAKCFDCHAESRDKVKGNLAFDNLKDMEEFYVGKYTTMRPGNPDESLLLEYVSDPNSPDTMPPSGKGERLTAEEIATVRKWLEEGAVIDASKTAVAQSGADMPVSERPMLTWTNSEGQTIEAKFLGMEGNAVKLLMANGKSYNYPLEKLDEASQKQAQELAGE